MMDAPNRSSRNSTNTKNASNFFAGSENYPQDQTRRDPIRDDLKRCKECWEQDNQKIAGGATNIEVVSVDYAGSGGLHINQSHRMGVTAC